MLPAAPPGADFQTYLQAALRMYESLDYEQALEKLARAKSYVRDLEDDALLSFYEGIILADMNRREQSRTAFRPALLLKPDATLPMKVSPKVEKDFEAVRADVRCELARTKQAIEPPAEATRQQPAALEKQVAPAPAAVEARRPALEPATSAPGLTAAPSAPKVSPTPSWAAERQWPERASSSVCPASPTTSARRI